MTNMQRLPAAPKLEMFPANYLNLEAHELANLLPMAEDVDYRRLRDDIARHGIRIPIMLFEGKILDGRNRYKAAKECGHVFEPRNFSEFSGSYDDAHAFVVSTNLQGRQLSNAQKQDFIRKMIEKYPALSNRQLAKEKCGGMSHTTVGTVREKMIRPPERIKFQKFMDQWEDLEDGYRVEFAKTFRADLLELLGISGGQNVRPNPLAGLGS